jgi:hypothetical protein
MLIPASLALYKYATAPSADAGGGEQQPALLTRLIRYYSDYRDRWETRNALHVKMVEQAAHDRNLFYSAKGTHAVDLRFPEYVFPFFFCFFLIAFPFTIF